MWLWLSCVINLLSVLLHKILIYSVIFSRSAQTIISAACFITFPFWSVFNYVSGLLTYCSGLFTPYFRACSILNSFKLTCFVQCFPGTRSKPCVPTCPIAICSAGLLILSPHVLRNLSCRFYHIPDIPNLASSVMPACLPPSLTHSFKCMRSTYAKTKLRNAKQNSIAKQIQNKI